MIPKKMTKSLMTFQESPLKTIGDEMDTRLWMQSSHDKMWFHRLGRRNILIASAVVGGQPAIETYTRAMIQEHDTTDCPFFGCEKGHHNYLFWSEKLKKASTIDELIMGEQGNSAVNTLQNLIKFGGGTLRSIGAIKDDKVVNMNGKPSPVVHQYQEDEELRGIVEKRTEKWMDDWSSVRGFHQTEKASNSAASGGATATLSS